MTASEILKEAIKDDLEAFTFYNYHHEICSDVFGTHISFRDDVGGGTVNVMYYGKNVKATMTVLNVSDPNVTEKAVKFVIKNLTDRDKKVIVLRQMRRSKHGHRAMAKKVKFKVTGKKDLHEMALDSGYDRCMGCGRYFEAGDMVDDDLNVAPCRYCKPGDD